MPDTPGASSSHPVTGAAGSTGSSAQLPFAPVNGSSDGSDAVSGVTNTGVAVRGTAQSGTGVSGESNAHGIGVLGYSQGGPALLAQADTAGVGLLALGSYDSNPPAGGIGSPLSMSGGVLPKAVTDLIQTSKGFAAIFSGKVSITDVLQAASTTLTGALTAASATLTGQLKASSVTLTGALNSATATVKGGLTAGSATITDELKAGSATLTGTLNGTAASFSGAVTATDVVLTGGGDCAEEFDLEDAQLQPGSVVVFTDNGGVAYTTAAYDRRVAGVISGAGSYRPGVILDRQAARSPRAPVALMGKVFCKVDAAFGAISVGDLLTTSPTAGCAMKATDPNRSFGAVIGKALASHAEGLGLIPMLVTLQ
jgi:hypothetical protein